MGDQTSIGYPDKTWSPWRTCSHAVYPPGHPRAGEVHPGCLNCYAEALNHFHTGWNGGQWGPGAPRTVAADSSWDTVLGWARSAAKAGARIRVFPSLCDPLDEEAPLDAQIRFWELVRRTAALKHDGQPIPPSHWQELDPYLVTHPLTFAWGIDWLLLTKRPWRWKQIPADVRRFIWLGTSVSSQPDADYWLTELLKAEGFRLFWCSYEPALGPVDFTWLNPHKVGDSSGPDRWEVTNALTGTKAVSDHKPPWVSDGRVGPRLSWVICGGESGGQRRPFEVAWMQKVADQCKDAGVAFWAKQDAAFRSGQQGRIPPELWARKEIPNVAQR